MKDVFKVWPVVQINSSYFSQKIQLSGSVAPGQCYFLTAMDSKHCIACVIKNGHQGYAKNVNTWVFEMMHFTLLSAICGLFSIGITNRQCSVNQ